MPTWKEQKQTELDGVNLTVKERTDLRNRHGAMEYIVEARIGGELVASERRSQSAWLGHCYGQLLLPEVAKRAKASRHNSVVSANSVCSLTPDTARKDKFGP